MESHRILICFALFAACAFAVNAAAIENQPTGPSVNVAAESQPTETKVAAAEPTSDDEHARQKKWAYAYGYGLTYPAAPAVAYSALPYYPAYRSAVPAYYPPPAAYYI